MSDQREDFSENHEQLTEGELRALVDPAFDDWLDSACGEARARSEATPMATLSGLASVFEKAHLRDPSRVSSARLDEAWRQAHPEDRILAASHRVDRLVVAAQAAVTTAKATRIPEPGFAPSRWTLRRKAVVRTFSAMAAAFALLALADQIGAFSMLGSVGGLAVEHQLSPKQASDVQATTAWVSASEVAPRLHAQAAKSLPDEVDAPSEEAVPEISPVEVAEEGAQALEPDPAPVRRRSLQEDLERWDQQAQAAWRAGRKDEARRLFLAIVRADRRGAFAQAAYGDLFLLARDSGSSAEQRKLWQQYLKSFRRGRFADDARAGLCRTAQSGAMSHCWRLYLSEFPHGTHRLEAESYAKVESP
jgi:hypothetical protein